MQVAGSLQVQMLMDLAEIKGQIDRASGMFEKFAGGVKTTLAGIGVGLGAHAFVDFIQGNIDALDHLNDLSKTSGLAVETLSGLSLAAKQSGTDLDGVAASVNKLSQNMGAAPDKFKALGISAKDPLDAFRQLSGIFVAIQDPQLRAAVAASALGKSWQSAAPLLSEGGASIAAMIEKGQRLSGVTKEMAEGADRFNDSLAELKATSSAFGVKLAGEMLPAFNQIIDAIKIAYDESGKLSALWTGMGALGSFLFTNEFASAKVKLADVNKDISGLEARINAGPQGYKGAFERFLADVQPKLKDLYDQRAALEAQLAAKPASTPPPPKTDPALAARARAFVDPHAGKDAEAAAFAANKLQSDLIKANFEQFKADLDARNQLLDLYHQNGLVGEQEFWKAKLNFSEQEAAKELAEIDALIKKEAERRALASGVKGGAPKAAEAEAAIAALQTKRISIVEKLGLAEQSMYFNSMNAAKQYQDQLTGLQAELLTLQGRSGMASVLQFDQSHKDIAQKAALNGDVATQKTLNDLKNAGELQAALNDKKVEYDAITTRLGINEDHVANLQKVGAVGDIDGMQRTGQLRQATILQLQDQLAIQQQLITAADVPDAVRQRAQLQLDQQLGGLEKLKTEADVLGNHFRDVFSGGISDAFNEFNDSMKRGEGGLKSLGNAFTSFSNSILKEMDAIAAKAAANAITKELFGASGSSGGGVFGDLIGGAAKLLGIGGKSSSGNGITANTVQTDVDNWDSSLLGNVAWAGSHAQGGSFDVGGSGGTDSQLVAFRASPNENVSIRRPDQMDDGGAPAVNLTVNIDATGADAAALGRVVQAVDQLRRNVVPMVTDAVRRGGQPKRYMGR